jgi:hypothetical protein
MVRSETPDAFDDALDDEALVARPRSRGAARRAGVAATEGSPGGSPKDSSGGSPEDSSGGSPEDSSGGSPEDTSGHPPADTSGVTSSPRPRLLVPLVLFVILIVGAVAAGRFVVPAGGPNPGSAPEISTGPRAVASTPATAQPSLPPLPTPPARPADALSGWAEKVAAVIAVPEVAIQAYGYAQLTLQRSDPGCHLTWTTLAGIGEVESQHGQAGGAVLQSTGRSTPPIVGPPLDGTNGRALVADTDAGAFDGDASFDHTMGPMHILPAVWRTYAVDADGDGIFDPYDTDDASLAMAGLLCSGTDDLSRLAGWKAALGRYHSGSSYADSVFAAANGYGQRTRTIS